MIDISLSRRVLRVGSNQDVLPGSNLSSTYGHIWLKKKNQDGDDCNATLKASKR